MNIALLVGAGLGPALGLAIRKIRPALPGRATGNNGARKFPSFLSRRGGSWDSGSDRSALLEALIALGRSLLSTVSVLLVVAGCASMRNTPAQDLAQERIAKCSNISGVNITRIEPSGRVWATFMADNRMAFNAWNACMQKA